MKKKPITKDSARDYIGQTFNRLTIIGVSKVKRRVAFVCDCTCGETKTINAYAVTIGAAKSCGCITREVMPELFNGTGRSKNPAYLCWISMISRCRNKASSSYKNYSERGIGVCDRWVNSFEDFIKDVGPRPDKKHSLERINNDEGYYPGNVRWATRVEQANNRRTNIYLLVSGEVMTAANLARVLKVNKQRVYYYIAKGMSGDAIRLLLGHPN